MADVVDFVGPRGVSGCVTSLGDCYSFGVVPETKCPANTDGRTDEEDPKQAFWCSNRWAKLLK